VLWIVSLPLAALLLGEPRRLAFPIYHPLVLLFGQNLMKVPPDLIAIARRLEADPDIPSGT